VNEHPTVISVEPGVVVVVQICNLFKSFLKTIINTQEIKSVVQASNLCKSSITPMLETQGDKIA
jgi:hypothetical protein